MYINTIIESRNALFFEDVFPYKEKESNTLKRSFDTTVSSSRDQVDKEKEEPRRSKRARVEKSYDPNFLTYLLKNKPQIFKEAMSSLEAPLWKEAMNSKI